MVANSVPVVRRAEPGLKTMIDVGLTSWFKGHKQDDVAEYQNLKAV